MKKNISKTLIILSIVLFLLPLQDFSVSATSYFNPESESYSYAAPQELTLQFNFSYPSIIIEDEYIWVYVNETDLNMIKPDCPVLPVNISELQFKFGTLVLDISSTISTPEIILLPGQLFLAHKPQYDSNQLQLSTEGISKTETQMSDPFPIDWISYHMGGGLSAQEHVTFFVLRVYPVRYFSEEHQLQFVQNVEVTIIYQEPVEPILGENDIYDLLIISPDIFLRDLKPLVQHKNAFGMKTRLVGLKEVNQQIYWDGRDTAEKIKIFIKEAVDHWDITYVLLVGGLKGQTLQWDLPVRYSHVVPLEEQEYAEPQFICDLYFADVYDSQGMFSLWDTNNNNIFAEWNETIKEDMDLYPDAYLGRLPCRNTREVKVLVRKIIQYEKGSNNPDWFKNLILVAGDSYHDENQFNEGELIGEAALAVMPGFNPVRVYASEQDINRRTVNNALNKGAGFAYFCGHGNPMSWTTHFPPDGKEWTTGYTVGDMVYLRNGYKLPVTIVGGCHNGQFDVSLMNIIQGIREDGLQYFSSKPGNAGRFWWNEWSPNCWAWWLTSKIGGGAIATIANTGLGTHGDGDLDNNDVADYLEVLDGWLELRFLQLFGEEQQRNLGENHCQTLTGYLHRFLGSEEKMDVKMVQQWGLFGDPSLEIGGYV
ncbi:MAG: hypothetical protein KKG04_08250 [Candidatus Thermoplasmatota archaeon]|nr:hypothetical protein [Candidatus Thermoplasmatota archaeon]